MNISKKLVIIFGTIIWASCSKNNLPGTNRNIQLKTNTDTFYSTLGRRPVPTPDSYLFSEVDKSIQDTVIKRIQMDLHPDIAYYRERSLLVRNDIPPINFSSLKFFPVVEAPVDRGAIHDKKLLWICKEVACLYGKTKSGEDIYILAVYKDWNKVPLDVSSPSYQAMVKFLGQEKVDAVRRSLLTRKDADCWDINAFVKGIGLYDEMDYARTHADNGKFFILEKGQVEFDVCYFEHGRALTCLKESPLADWLIRDFTRLMNYD
jgi:hypothetical protein